VRQRELLGDTLHDRVFRLQDLDRAGLAVGSIGGKATDRLLDLDLGGPLGELAEDDIGRYPRIGLGHGVALRWGGVGDLHFLRPIGRELALDVALRPLVHGLDKRRGPVGRVKGDQSQTAARDLLHDFAARFRLDVFLADMAPPDEHVAGVKNLVRQALLRVVLLDRLDGQARFRLEVACDPVAQKVVVRFFLGGLLLVPDDNADRRGRRRREAGGTEQDSGARSGGRCFQEFAARGHGVTPRRQAAIGPG